jgi:hypothetical protein
MNWSGSPASVYWHCQIFCGVGKPRRPMDAKLTGEDAGDSVACCWRPIVRSRVSQVPTNVSSIDIDEHFSFCRPW